MKWSVLSALRGLLSRYMPSTKGASQKKAPWPWWTRKPLTLGAKGELAARKHLRSCGHRILDTNYTHKLGELDIVSEYREIIVFTEVKTRTESEDFRPADNLGPAKIRKLRRIAEIYLKHRALTGHPVQFDVIELVYPAGERRKPKLEHFERAF